MAVAVLESCVADLGFGRSASRLVDDWSGEVGADDTTARGDLGRELERKGAERRKYIAELQERAHHAEREAEHDRLLAAAEERARIARDLHDSAGHAISVDKCGRVWVRAAVETMTPFDMPPNLADAALAEGRASWLEDLPAKIGVLSQRWQLAAVGAPFRPGGRTAWVAPVQTRSRSDLVLKIAWRHREAEGEADGLRAFDGQGAVRLFAAEMLDARTYALLIERCRPGMALSTRPEDEQDAVVAGLLQRLWATAEAGYGFASLQAMCDSWADQLEARTASTRPAIDPGLAREGTALFRSLPASAERSVLLCTDLHAGNVLAAEREPWLVIDPKPHVGDPTYDVVQHILNCDERLRHDPHGLVRRIADLADLDPDRLGLWLFARCVIEAPDWPPLAEVARQLAP